MTTRKKRPLFVIAKESAVRLPEVDAQALLEILNIARACVTDEAKELLSEFSRAALIAAVIVKSQQCADMLPAYGRSITPDPHDRWYAYECPRCSVVFDLRADMREHGEVKAQSDPAGIVGEPIANRPKCGQVLDCFDWWPADIAGYGSRGCPRRWTPYRNNSQALKEAALAAGAEEDTVTPEGYTKLPTQMMDVLGLRSGGLLWFLRTRAGGPWEAWLAEDLGRALGFPGKDLCVCGHAHGDGGGGFDAGPCSHKDDGGACECRGYRRVLAMTP